MSAGHRLPSGLIPSESAVCFRQRVLSAIGLIPSGSAVCSLTEARTQSGCSLSEADPHWGLLLPQ